jgi:hypothetical protein
MSWRVFSVLVVPMAALFCAPSTANAQCSSCCCCWYPCCQPVCCEPVCCNVCYRCCPCDCWPCNCCAGNCCPGKCCPNDCGPKKGANAYNEYPGLQTAEGTSRNMAADTASAAPSAQPARTVARTYLASYETTAAGKSRGDEGRPQDVRRSTGESLRPALEWWAENRRRPAQNDLLPAPVPRRIASPRIEQVAMKVSQ